MFEGYDINRLERVSNTSIIMFSLGSMGPGGGDRVEVVFKGLEQTKRKSFFDVSHSFGNNAKFTSHEVIFNTGRYSLIEGVYG